MSGSAPAGRATRRALLPNRQSIRLRGWDYTAAGWYFVTCNTHENRPLFGSVVNGRMMVNAAGRIAAEEWQRSAVIRKEMELDEFVVMPNHVHGIVRIKRGDLPVARARGGQPVARLLPRSLGAFIAGYKGAVGKRLNELRHSPGAVVWHRNYWDVIVRDEQVLANIRQYIRFNPQNYQAVMQSGEPRARGNRALLELRKLGFLASRGESSRHGKLPLKSGEAIISGFLSPMERAVLKAGLDNHRPTIWVRPWGLRDDAETAAVRLAIEAGRLLLLSPFDDEIEAPSVRRAAWCNQYVLAHCDRLAVGYLNPDGMLACILSEADPAMEIAYL
jgi:REP element-mobilizing transposase RayT